MGRPGDGKGEQAQIQDMGWSSIGVRSFPAGGTCVHAAAVNKSGIHSGPFFVESCRQGLGSTIHQPWDDIWWVTVT